MADWLVGQALPKQESTAHASLTGMGFHCYQPKYRERCIVKGRKTWVERLLLGRYLLIEFVFDFVGHYHEIITAKGVASLLVADERPLVARDKEVRRLQGSEVRGCVPMIVQRSRFKQGQEVLVTKGPFSDLKGQYVEGKEDRDVVGLELFGGFTSVELELGRLIAV
jgi:transcription antitermination factor NusG